MKFAVWLRAVIDALTRTPYLVSLREELDLSRKLRYEQQQRFEVTLLGQRQDLTERIRDKDAVINDLRGRLAVAEADVVREKVSKQPRPSKPVPDFGGPISHQDELAQMSLEVDETQENQTR